MKRSIGGFEFQNIGSVRLMRDASGYLLEYVHQLPSGVKPNRYAAGPFCTFALPEAPPAGGVYALIADNEIKYIGESENLRQRFGPAGYGSVAPRNCHADGQATNCKINALVLNASKAGQLVEVWFLASVDHKSIESGLLFKLTPPWNGARPMQPEKRSKSLQSSDTPASLHPTASAVFESALQAELAAAERSGQRSVRIRSGDLHRQVGGYPGAGHRMPMCCKAMKQLMLAGDRIITSPPKGAGANLVVEYQLPRGSLSNRALEPSALA